jgi:GNAT superfamily N-acetyltransferase
MASILQLRRQIESRPEISSIPGVEIRHYQGEADIPAWLQLRHQAFARQRMGVRQWSSNDFHAEFTGRWWWQPEHMWLAESVNSWSESLPLAAGQGSGASSQRQLIGTVTLAMRGEPDQSEPVRPVVHWLIVHPRWRRRGIGRLLMAQLESAAWEAGHRDLWLETHTAWEAAVKFYQSLGYSAE